jgi:hypothetical protein
MTSSSADSATYAAPPNVQITFHDNVVQPELRLAAERSVAAIIARSVETADKVRAADGARAKLLAAVNAPLMRLIEEDPAAVKALNDLSNQFLDLDSPILPLGDVPIHDVREAATLGLADVREAREIRVLARVPPFDYAWIWFHPDGSGPANQHLSNEGGTLGLVARSGYPGTSGGAPGFVAAHVGFGLWLTTDREVTAIGYATPHMMRRWRVSGNTPVDFATAQAGKEFTAVEDGRVIESASANLFNESVYGTDSSSGLSPDYIDLLEPRSLVFRMMPRLPYTFNVGIWVYSNIAPAQTAAKYSPYAESWLSGWVPSMSVVR